MKHIVLSFLIPVLFPPLLLKAQTKPGDTLSVKVFTWQDPSPEGWCAQYKGHAGFPENGEWFRILMIQTLKCDQATKGDTFPCGEWDYIWHTTINIPKGDTVEPYCIGSFVTPYGKRLKMGGEDGWKWLYDVTDYAPILKGKREIISGNNQELLDLEFIFIAGKPARNVISVDNTYPFGSYTYERLASDSVLKKKDIILNPQAKGFMLRARISGHGHAGPHNCCEWDSKTHTYHIGEWEQFRWNVWKDCGLNAIYPQGGTWPFDRAGWCPGTKVDEYDFELTPKVHPGDTIAFDYSIENFTGNGEKDGNFQMTHQLFSYGPPNYLNNAGIVTIMTPTDEDEYSRINPICSNPRIVIRNNGKNPLKSLTVRYGLSGGQESVYRWNGYLDFLEKQEVWLPAPDWSQLSENSRFTVRIEKPNNAIDENPIDDVLSSKVQMPAGFPCEFTIHIKTNNLGRAAENTCLVTSANGDVMYRFENYTDSTEYFHDIILPEGCYEFRFTDDMEDGIMLHWWNFYDDKENVGITGKVEILSTDRKGVLFSFPPDFGQELLLNFITSKK
ncbi:MAG: peptide-N-glycosidase F-related protein [Bacteroidota bacterium]